MAAEREAAKKAHYEHGESSRAQENQVPPYVPMGQNDMYMNFPDLFASVEVHAIAMKMVETWLGEKIQTQLGKHLISVCVVDSCNDLALNYFFLFSFTIIVLFSFFRLLI